MCVFMHACLYAGILSIFSEAKIKSDRHEIKVVFFEYEHHLQKYLKIFDCIYFLL